MLHAPQTACLMLALVCALPAQIAQPGSQFRSLPLRYPGDVEMARFVPFPKR